MESKKHIEIEFRSMFNKKKFDLLHGFLHRNALDLGQDDKDAHFYIFPDKLLKVTDNVSKKSAKLTLKLNRIGQGSNFEEIEFPIDRADVRKAVKMFNYLEMTDNIIHSFQSRHNYRYKGVELALKYSHEWKYHLELEIVVQDESQKESAVNQIKNVARVLDVRVMSEDELKKFVKKVERSKRKR